MPIIPAAYDARGYAILVAEIDDYVPVFKRERERLAYFSQRQHEASFSTRTLACCVASVVA